MRMDIGLKLLKRLNVIIQLSTIWPILSFLQHAINIEKNTTLLELKTEKLFLGAGDLLMD